MLLVLRSSWQLGPEEAGCGREQGGQGQASSFCNKEDSRCVQTAIWRRSRRCSVASLLLGSCSWRLLSPRQPSQLGICRAPPPSGPAGGLRQVAPLDTGEDEFLLCLAVRKKEFQLSCSQVLRTVCVCVCVCLCVCLCM